MNKPKQIRRKKFAITFTSGGAVQRRIKVAVSAEEARSWAQYALSGMIISIDLLSDAGGTKH